MIKELNFSDKLLAGRALTIQKVAYRIEADLIGFDGIPQLHETIRDLEASQETFYGYFVDDELAGVISCDIENGIVDIGRLVVHPDYFRRGIGRQLVNYILSNYPGKTVIVSTGAKNQPARQLYERLGFRLLDKISLPEGVRIARYEKQNP